MRCCTNVELCYRDRVDQSSDTNATVNVCLHCHCFFSCVGAFSFSPDYSDVLNTAIFVPRSLRAIYLRKI